MEGLDHLRIARINQLRLVAGKEDELWLQIELFYPIEEDVAAVLLFLNSVSNSSEDKITTSHGVSVTAAANLDGRRSLMFRHFSIAKLPSDWMVSAVNGAAFRNEITLFVATPLGVPSGTTGSRSSRFCEGRHGYSRRASPPGQYSIPVNQRALGSNVFLALNVIVHLFFENLEG